MWKEQVHREGGTAGMLRLSPSNLRKQLKKVVFQEASEELASIAGISLVLTPIY